MKSRALISIAITLCASLVSFPLAAQEGNNFSSAPREYTLQVLPGPPGLTGTGNAYSINDRGWATGLSNPSDDSYDQAVLWRQGQATNLGNLAGGQPRYNSSGPINNRNDTGWVVGVSETLDLDLLQENFGGFICPPSCASHIVKGFLWQSATNTMIALPPLPGGNNSVGAGANNQEIFGYSENGVSDGACQLPQMFDFEGVVWQLDSSGAPFIAKLLPPLTGEGDTVSAGLGINESGDIVGQSGLCAAIAKHAVLWKNDGSVIDLGNLGGTTNIAIAINNQGQVVGISVLSDDLTPHAFLWQEGTGMQDLGALPGDDQSSALAINDSGEVVGVSCNSATGNCRSFHWQRSVMTDISALPAVSRLVGVHVNDINSRGEIPIAANDPTVPDPNDPTGYLQIAAVLIPAPTGNTPSALMIPDAGSAATQLGLNAVSADSLPNHMRTLLQQRMKLGPLGPAPSVIPAHSTRPNADALVSALAGVPPRTSNATTQSCRPDGAACGQGVHCCGLCSATKHTCCSKLLPGTICTSSAQCCHSLCVGPPGRTHWCL